MLKRFHNLNPTVFVLILWWVHFEHSLQAFVLVGSNCFFRTQTLTTRGVSSKFSSDALKNFFCEAEPCRFEFTGLDAMNEVESLRGDCQPPPCSAEHEGTGRTTESSNLLRGTISNRNIHKCMKKIAFKKSEILPNKNTHRTRNHFFTICT